MDTTEAIEKLTRGYEDRHMSAAIKLIALCDGSDARLHDEIALLFAINEKLRAEINQRNGFGRI